MNTRLVWVRNVIIGLGFAWLVTGCMPPTNPDSYTAYDAGMKANVYQGVIVDIRQVTLEGGTDVGAPIGAVVGGVGGSFIGSRDAPNVVGALGGALVGGIAGYYIDKSLTTRDALQYIIKLDNSKTVAVVQGKQPALANGQRVLVLFDRRKTRVVPDNTLVESVKTTVVKKTVIKPVSGPVIQQTIIQPVTTPIVQQTVIKPVNRPILHKTVIRPTNKHVKTAFKQKQHISKSKSTKSSTITNTSSSKTSFKQTQSTKKVIHSTKKTKTTQKKIKVSY